MKQEKTSPSRVTFPENKRNKFQEKFAQLLKGEELGDQNGIEFAFNHNFSENNDVSKSVGDFSKADSKENLEYEQQIRDLKKRVEEKNYRKYFQKDSERRESEDEERYEQERERREDHEKRQFEYYSNQEGNWNRQHTKPFDPDDLRLSRIPKLKNQEKERRTHDDRQGSNEDYYYKEEAKDFRKSKQKNSSRKKEDEEGFKESAKPRMLVPSRSEYSISQVSNNSKKFKSNFQKASTVNLSNYKKYMIFSARLKLKKIKFGSKKTGMLKFDIEYNNNFIPARRNHEINGFEAYIKENFEVPFRAIYDRRKRQFYCENIIINVMNMYKRYNKRLGQLEVSASEILNQQQAYFNGKIKLKKTSDRQAVMDIVFSMKFQGVSDKDHTSRNDEMYHFDDSYFSTKSEK